MTGDGSGSDRSDIIWTDDVRLPNEVCGFEGFAEHPHPISAVTVSTPLEIDSDEQRRAGAQGLLEVLERSPDLRGRPFFLLDRVKIETVGAGRVVRRKGYWGHRPTVSIPGLVRGPDILLRETPGACTFGSCATFPADQLGEALYTILWGTSPACWIPSTPQAMTEDTVREWFDFLDQQPGWKYHFTHHYFAAARRVVDRGGAFLRVWPGDYIYDPHQLTLFYRPDGVRMVPETNAGQGQPPV